MADINLDDLLKAKRAQEGSEAAAATGKELVTVEQVSAAVETLTPEEKAQIVKIKDELDLTDSTAVLSYGAPAQQSSTGYAAPAAADNDQFSQLVDDDGDLPF